MSEATPRPWEYIGLSLSCRDAYQRDIEPPQEGMKIIDASGAKLFEDWFNGAEQDEMWKLIVRAVNAHEGLVEALEKTISIQTKRNTHKPDCLINHGYLCDCGAHKRLLGQIQTALDAAKGEL